MAQQFMKAALWLAFLFVFGVLAQRFLGPLL